MMIMMKMILTMMMTMVMVITKTIDEEMTVVRMMM